MVAVSLKKVCEVLICAAVRTYDEQITTSFFQAEDGIRDVERSRGLGDVYKRQLLHGASVYDGHL